MVCPQPTPAAQVSLVQGLLSLQLREVPPLHTPAWQVSVPSQGLPLLHSVPLATAVARQPSTESQVSMVHGLPSLQIIGVAPPHAPA
jgi:hypothetical protein